MKGEKLIKASFRDKITGWKHYSLRLESKNHVYCKQAMDNLFFRGYISNLYLRPSCYNCPVKAFRNCSDLTLGDYWGIDKILPKFNDNKGVSIVLINTDKGNRYIKKANLDKIEASIDDAIFYNPSITRCSKKSFASYFFWSTYRIINYRAINFSIKINSYYNILRSLATKVSKIIIR
jgi:hypothetical protein